MEKLCKACSYATACKEVINCRETNTSSSLENEMNDQIRLNEAISADDKAQLRLCLSDPDCLLNTKNWSNLPTHIWNCLLDITIEIIPKEEWRRLEEEYRAQSIKRDLNDPRKRFGIY